MQNTCYVTLEINESGSAQNRVVPLGFMQNQQCFSQAITRPLFPHSEPRRHLSSQTGASISKSWNKADDRGRGAGVEGRRVCVAELSSSRSARDSSQVSDSRGCRGRNGRLRGKSSRDVTPDKRSTPLPVHVLTPPPELLAAVRQKGVATSRSTEAPVEERCNRAAALDSCLHLGEP